MIFKQKLPLPAVKSICVGAVLFGLFGFVSGNWIVGLCMLLGSYLMERNLYRCPVCGKKLDMKAPLFHGSRCPQCQGLLRS